jgi:NAD(P)-dependent dehydrogenase (short-subunit alcohol dehydrogenase family)
MSSETVAKASWLEGISRSIDKTLSYMVAVLLVAMSLAVRYAKDNIRTNILCPSTVDPPLVQEMMKNPERRQERLGEVPLGRLASLEDVASAALYLASDEAAFINGVALPVDGGVTAW